MKHISYFVCVVGLLFSVNASAQYGGVKIKTGPNGSTVETDQAKIKSNKDGSNVTTGAATVKTDKNGSTVTTGAATVTTKKKKAKKKYKDHKPISCQGTRDITLKGIKIKSNKTAVNAQGSCTIKLTDCWIEGKTALKLQGSVDLKLTRCIVKGSSAALDMQGSVDVSAKDTEFHGKIKKQGAVDIEDNGGNKYLKK